MTLLNSPQKARVIALYAENWPENRTFVETGTGYGVLVNALALTFDRIFSVEFDWDLAEQARVRCDGWPNINIFAGRSEEYLSHILSISGPSVIFLDAHHNDDPGASALATELDVIDADPNACDHVILIDDARLCRDDNGWVSLEGIRAWGAAHGLMFELEDDIVRLTP